MTHFWAALKKYATFSGRASRAEYFYFVMPLILLSGVIGYVITDSLFAGIEEEVQGMTEWEIRAHISGLNDVAQVLTILVFLPFLLPLLAVTVRRLHDYGLSGWWVLGVTAVSRFSDIAISSAMDKAESATAVIFLSLFSLIVWILVGLPESETDENKYGVPPGQEGAETSATLIKDWTPLHEAAEKGDTETALALINAGAKLDALDYDEETPLDVAIDEHGEDSEIARILREAMERQGG